MENWNINSNRREGKQVPSMYYNWKKNTFLQDLRLEYNESYISVFSSMEYSKAKYPDTLPQDTYAQVHEHDIKTVKVS